MNPVRLTRLAGFGLTLALTLTLTLGESTRSRERRRRPSLMQVLARKKVSRALESKWSARVRK